MVELQDTVIKLFGKKISLPEITKTCLAAKKVEEHAHKDQNLAEESENPKGVQNSKDDDSDTKPLKKPDEIIACPRCNSMDTKFCYYNNYNTNQPRHFCKSCQRYWTNGGTMRNVPVGSGRRKNKSHLSASYHLPNHQESLEVACVDSKILVPNFTSTEKILCFDAVPHGIPDPKVQNFHGFSYPSVLPWPYPVYPVNDHWISARTVSGSTDQVLGKRSRDQGLLGQINLGAEIDGADDTVKNLFNREGLFKGFEAQCGKKKQMIDSVFPALQANPAAMSRSLNFKERA